MSNLTAQVKSIHEDAKSCALEVLEETIQQLSRLDASLGEIMSAIATAEVELDKRVGAREKLHGPPGKCLRARREELWDADCEFADNILTTAAFRLENSHFSLETSTKCWTRHSGL